MACPICGESQVHDTRPMELNYKGLSKTVDMPGLYCTSCGEGVLSGKDTKESERALAELKARYANVYTPDEIKEIRKSLHLNQLEAGKVLGGGERSFQRYEAGSITVSKPMHNLLKLIKQHPDLIKELRE